MYTIPGEACAIEDIRPNRRSTKPWPVVAPLNIGPIPVFVPAFLITVIAIYLHSGPFTAVSQNVVSPALRASCVTLLLFVSHVFGDSHSTFDVGWISDHVGSLQLALLITSPTLLVVAAIIAATGLRSVKPDTERMEGAWAARPAEPEPQPQPKPTGSASR